MELIDVLVLANPKPAHLLYPAERIKALGLNTDSMIMVCERHGRAIHVWVELVRHFPGNWQYKEYWLPVFGKPRRVKGKTVRLAIEVKRNEPDFQLATVHTYIEKRGRKPKSQPVDWPKES
jgi:hypothetical protein